MWGALILMLGVFLISDGWKTAPSKGWAVAGDAGSREDFGSSYDIYSFRTPTPIPDGDRVGSIVGPIRIPADGGALTGVIVSISIAHPNTGDLALRLSYDENNDGHADATAALEPYRARPGGWAVREPFACPIEMNGVYYFRDEPSGEVEGRGDASLAVFNGRRRGGSFVLSVVDSLPADTGTLLGWTVFVKRSTLITDSSRLAR